MKDAALVCYDSINDIWRELEETLDVMNDQDLTAGYVIKFLKSYVHGLHESSNTLETKRYSADIYGYGLKGE